MRNNSSGVNLLHGSHKYKKFVSFWVLFFNGLFFFGSVNISQKFCSKGDFNFKTVKFQSFNTNLRNFLAVNSSKLRSKHANCKKFVRILLL